MGQYYLVVNKTKKQYLRPHNLNDGAKFMELVGGTTPQVMAFLMVQSDGEGGGDGNRQLSLRGSWAGDNITIVGDYDSSNLYSDAREDYENISLEALEQFEQL